MSGSHFVLHIFSPLTPAINQTVIFVLKPFTTIQQAIIQDSTLSPIIIGIRSEDIYVFVYIEGAWKIVTNAA